MKKSTKLLTVALLSATIFNLNLSQLHASGISFKDVMPNFWGHANIQWAVDNNLVDGYPDGTFKPNQFVTQEEFLAMLIRTYQPSDFNATSNTDHWAMPYLQYATKLNWQVKSTSAMENPPLTRGSVARILANATGNNYTANDSIQYLLDLGVSQGKTGNSIEDFKQDDSLTRTEAIAFIQRIKEKFDKLQSMPLYEQKYVPKTQSNQANNQQAVKDFTITAKNVKWEIKPGLTIDAMTYNGTVPGTTIRVTEGARIRVKLENQLNEPTTIHWHGIPLDNPNDGIPGVTQNAVKPNESFTYDFIAKTPGTYMYHSHQNGVNQIDKGLYGILIIDPKQPTVKYDRDYALMLDEWITGDNNMAGMNMDGQSNGGHDMPGMNMDGQSNGGHDMPGMNMDGQSNGGHDMPAMKMEEQMMAMYNTFTINGKSDTAIKPLEVKKGERVKVRLINIGNQTHKMHLHGASFKVTDTDGQPINEPQELKDVLVAVGAGERYDLEFVATGEPILLESHDDRPAAPQMKVTFASGSDLNAQKDTGKDKKMNEANLSVLNIAEYGKPKTALFTADTKFDKNLTMDLGANIATDGQVSYSINGKSFPNFDPFMVKQGDKVKIRIVNKSGNFIHPMHLHGHFFQVLSKNGKPVTGSPIMKDTINVLPDEEYEIAFVADNPGDWVFHCHDLHHAEAGMVTMVKYEGYKPNFTVDPTVGNKPE